MACINDTPTECIFVTLHIPRRSHPSDGRLRISATSFCFLLVLVIHSITIFSQLLYIVSHNVPKTHSWSPPSSLVLQLQLVHSLVSLFVSICCVACDQTTRIYMPLLYLAAYRLCPYLLIFRFQFYIISSFPHFASDKSHVRCVNSHPSSS